MRKGVGPERPPPVKIFEVRGPVKIGLRDLYHLPHSAVVKEERLTTTVRVVFDGSAENGDGISLNSQLLEGPALQQDIAALQILLRMKKYVIIGDISRMFYNIYLQEQFRDYYRFLWNFDTNANEPKVYRFRSITMGAKDSPFLAIPPYITT